MSDQQQSIVDVPYLKERINRRRIWRLAIAGTGCLFLLSSCCVTVVVVWMFASNLRTTAYTLVNPENTAQDFGNAEFRVCLISKETTGMFGNKAVVTIIIKNTSETRIVNFANRHIVVVNPDFQISDEHNNNYKVTVAQLPTFPLRPGQEALQTIIFESPVEKAKRLTINGPTGLPDGTRVSFTVPLSRSIERINEQDVVIFFKEKDYKKNLEKIFDPKP